MKKNVKLQYKNEAMKQVKTNHLSTMANPSGFKL